MNARIRLAAVLLPSLALACGPLVPEPGTRSNGTFRFLAGEFRGAEYLDARAVASRGGTIAAGTNRDLRVIRGSKADGFSEPAQLDLTELDAAEVNGLAFAEDPAVLFVGYALGIAVVDVSGAARVTARVDLTEPVARLYRDGPTLLALSFDNELRLFSADSNPPAPLGVLKLEGGTGTVRSATLHGGKATLSAPGAVWVVEYADASKPSLVARHDLPIMGDTVRGPTHLFTGHTGALAVIAMPDDATVTPVGPAAPPWRLPSAAPLLAGDRLFVVDDEDGTLYVADVSVPSEPRAVTYLEPDRTRVPCGNVRQTLLDDDGVLWVACAGGLVAYVIDF